jgi:hypothetical protein
MPCGKRKKKSKKITKKRKKLIVYLFPSGIVGKGKPKVKIVTSVLTPKQYEKRFYHSSYHFRTEYAIEVERYIEHPFKR